MSKYSHYSQSTLVWHSPLEACSDSIRIAYQSQDKKRDKQKELDLVKRVGNQMKHGSTLEHIVMHFYIENMPRFILQEWARHRMQSMTVKSTRWTLSELKGKDSFILHQFDFGRASKYVYLLGDIEIDMVTVRALENVRKLVENGVSNDKAKMAIPEAYLCDLRVTINMRSLQNMWNLRTAKTAHFAYRELMQNIHDSMTVELQEVMRGVKNG
jgi:thymidylate synthase (FAD)